MGRNGMGCECLRRIKNQMETLGLFCFVYRKTGFVFTLLYNNNRRKEKKNFLLFHIKSCFYPYACVCVKEREREHHHLLTVLDWPSLRNFRRYDSIISL